MPSGGNTTIQKSDPWSGVQPYLTDQYANVNALANSGILPYFPGQTYAPFNALQVGGQYGALDYTQNRFQPGVGALQSGLQQTMSSAQQGPQGNPYQTYYEHMFNAPSSVARNPFVQQMMDRNADSVYDNLMRRALPQARSGAAMAGQYGGSKQGVAEGIAMGDAAKALADANAQTQMGAWNTAMGQQRSGAQLMGGAYGTQTQASLDAMRQMPGALQLGMLGPQTAMQIGQQQQDQYNRSIQEQMARYYYPEQVAWERQGQLANILSGAQPYASQTTQGPGSNPLAGALGGAASGAGIASALSLTGPWGIGLAGLGGLFGAMG